MRVNNIAFGIVFLLSSLVYAQGDCDLEVQKTYRQVGYDVLYPSMPVPDAIVSPVDSDYYIVFTHLSLEETQYWGKRLHLNGVYCKKSNKQEMIRFKAEPGTNVEPDGHYPRIVYYGAIPNTLCQKRESKFGSSNTLLFAGTQGFESLLFKSVVARHYRTVNKKLSTPNLVVGLPNLPRSLGDPEGVDLDARSACKAKVMIIG